MTDDALAAMSSPRWTRGIGGQWLVSWQAYAIGTPVVFVAFTLSGAIEAPSTPSDVLARALSVLLACLAAGAWMLVAAVTFLRNRATHPIPAALAVAYLGSVGTVFTLVLIATTPAAELPPASDRIALIAVGTGMAAWFGTVLVLLLDAREGISRLRASVIDSAVEQEITAIEQADLSRLLRDYLDVRVEQDLRGTRDRLEMALADVDIQARTDAWVEISEELRTMARSSVRALSSDLWVLAEAKYPRVNALTILPRVVRTQPLRPLAVATLAALLILPDSVNRLGAVQGTLAALVGALGMFVILAAANAVMRRWPAAHGAIFIGSILFITAGSVISATRAQGSLSWSQVLLSLLATSVVIIGTSTLAAISHVNAQSLLVLSSRVSAGEVSARRRQRQLAVIARQAAQILHGQFQTRLIASAAAIDRAVDLGDSESLALALRRARDILEAPLSPLPPAASLEEILTEQRRRWHGLLDIDIDPAGMPDEGDPQVLQDASLAAEEAISNAFRHGDARRVHVRILDEGDDLRIIVEDDGTGPPQECAPGTGSALLDHLAPGAWSLECSPRTGGACLDICIRRRSGARTIGHSP